MKPDDYLKAILEEQTFSRDAPELEDLRSWRMRIQDVLEKSFSTPSIRWAGSMAKGTMIREAYDGDMTCYFPRDENEAGETLEEIYDSVARVLKAEFEVERKKSALRIKDRSTTTSKGVAADLHIDVVPGRFTDEDETDVFLHQENGNKDRLKTNLEIHIEHIRECGVRPAIRLMKLWNVRNGVGAKTFVLELLVVKLLEGRKDLPLSEQLEHVWTEFRDNAAALSVEDPANPKGNDLTPMLDEVRQSLSQVAADTLWQIEQSGWEAVFGPVGEGTTEEVDDSALEAASAAVVSPTKPWLQGA